MPWIICGAVSVVALYLSIRDRRSVRRWTRDRECEEREARRLLARERLLAIPPLGASRDDYYSVNIGTDGEFELQNCIGANFAGGDLHGCNCVTANFTRANLAGANLTKTNFARSVLINADLSGADLSGADLRATDLSGANLRDAKFTGTLACPNTIWPEGFDPLGAGVAVETDIRYDPAEYEFDRSQRFPH